MVNEITTAIAQQLDNVFDGIEIHIDELPQGFTEPCFFILMLTMTQKQILNDRYYREHRFNIQYFPANENPTREINKVADRLWMALEYINMNDGLLRGTDMHREIQDGVLHFFVNYDCFVVKAWDRGSLMQVLKQNRRVKKNRRG